MGNFYMEATQINYRRDDKLKTVDQKLQELSETSAIDTDIAPVFKSTNTYQPGDMVYYRNKLYVFNVEHTGAWAAADVTATDVTTELSSLKSGLTNLDVDIDAPNRKNLLPMTLANIKAVNSGGTWTDNVLVYKGVTYTVNLDASGNVTSIKADGTADASGSTCTICSQSTPYIRQELNGKTLTYSGCPAGGSEQTYNLYGWKVTTGESGIRDTGSGVTFNAINMNSSFNFAVIIGASYVIPEGGITFYPMLRLATETDATFAPYIPSVESRLNTIDGNLYGKLKLNLINGTSIYDYLRDASTPVGLTACDVQGATDNPVTGTTSYALVYKGTSSGSYSCVQLISGSGLYRTTILMPSDSSLTFVKLADAT